MSVSGLRVIDLDFIPIICYPDKMDWTLAIERHRLALLRIVAALFAVIGLDGGSAVARLPWPVYRAVASVLRPAEAAVRRLIVVAARGVVVKPSAPRSAPAGLVMSRMGQGRMSFQLFDPRRVVLKARDRRDGAMGSDPSIRVIDVTFDPRIPLFRPVSGVTADAPDVADDHTVNAVPLCRRLAAIRKALDDLPRQARRYARWQARPVGTRRPKRPASLRTGPPPGLRRRPAHEVEEILAECHWLARHAAASDTS